MTLWDEEKQEVVCVLGPMPPTFEEYDKVQKQSQEFHGDSDES